MIFTTHDRMRAVKMVLLRNVLRGALMHIEVEEGAFVIAEGGRKQIFKVNWACAGSCTVDQTRGFIRELRRTTNLAERLNEADIRIDYTADENEISNQEVGWLMDLMASDKDTQDKAEGIKWFLEGNMEL